MCTQSPGRREEKGLWHAQTPEGAFSLSFSSYLSPLSANILQQERKRKRENPFITLYLEFVTIAVPPYLQGICFKISSRRLKLWIAPKAKHTMFSSLITKIATKWLNGAWYSVDMLGKGMAHVLGPKVGQHGMAQDVTMLSVIQNLF